VDDTARCERLYGRLLALPLLRRSLSPGRGLPVLVLSDLRRESTGWPRVWQLRLPLPRSSASAENAWAGKFEGIAPIFEKADFDTEPEGILRF